MIVSTLELNNFTRHKKTFLQLPKAGVVLVTGPNGSGKSSLPEAVAYGGWGQTLRGTLPFSPEGGSVEVETGATMDDHGLTIRRTRSKAGSTKLAWKEGSEEAVEYETTGKAQDALEAFLGGFEVWRRTHVFSSADASRFTDATDKERKLFLENYLGAGRFDAAAKDCREALRNAERALDRAEGAIVMARSEKTAAETRIADADAVLKNTPEPVEISEELKKNIRGLEAEIDTLQRGIRTASNMAGQGRGELGSLKRQADRLGQGTCDACGQKIPAELVKELRKKIAGIEAKLKAQEGAAAAEESDLQIALEDAQHTLTELRKLTNGAEASAGFRRSRAAAEQAKRIAQATLKQADKALKAAQDDLEKQSREKQILDAADTVLGLKGVRAGLLARLLSSLEGAANAWLQRFAMPGLKIELKPYAEKKSGGVSDAIGLTVHGAGGGFGYRAASGGERRRIDLALLLAFAGDGTLFLDECMDALDEDGVHAACEVLGDLSKDRAVVLITHSQELARHVPYVSKITVNDGEISQASVANS